MKQKSFSIWRYLKRHTKKIVLSCILMSISSVCSFILPSIMSEILDQGVTFASEETFPQIITNCLWMLGFSVINIGVSLLSAYISIIVTNSFTKDIEDDIFNTVNHMSFEEVNHFGIGTLITRTTHDIGTISWVANMMTGTIFIIPILFIAGVVMCFLKDVQLAIIILLCLPLIILFIALLSKKILPLWDLSEKYCDLQNDSVRERLRGIRVIRAFNNEPKEQAKIEKATHLMAENIIKANVSECIVDPFARLLIYIAIILVIFVGGVRIQNTGKLSAGDIFAIIQYMIIILSAVLSGSFAIIMLPQAKVAIKRITEIFNYAKNNDKEEPLTEHIFKGKIEFKDVSFTYTGADLPALEHISFTIQPGQKVSIIGGTGSGKSTIISLLLAFRKLSSGSICYDDVDINDIGNKNLRANISCSLQNALIFSGTFLENISMGKPGSSLSEVWEATDIAQLTEVINEKGEIDKFQIEQAGSNLSGGQKQRLAIARTVIKPAAIYVFDDSFSALDFLTEAKVRKAINEKMSGKTQIVVTQRVTSAMYSDLILVMDNGKLIDQGTHSELINRCGIYRDIFNSQTGKKVEGNYEN